MNNYLVAIMKAIMISILIAYAVGLVVMVKYLYKTLVGA